MEISAFVFISISFLGLLAVIGIAIKKNKFPSVGVSMFILTLLVAIASLVLKNIQFPMLFFSHTPP